MSTALKIPFVSKSGDRPEPRLYELSGGRAESANDTDTVIEMQNLNVYYNGKQAVHGVDLSINPRQVTAFIGASGCGKSTILRCINRMNDTIESCRVEGQLLFNHQDIYAPGFDSVAHRARIGMIFQKPTPFPRSIFKNIAYGIKIHGIASHPDEVYNLVQESLELAGLWREVHDRLDQPATELSGGQQQRLCIARAIAIKPEVILMDEPCSALDPIATARIENLVSELKKSFTLIVVTHSMQQAARVSQKTAFFHMGRLIEYDDTLNIFESPKHELTQNYITGRFGETGVVRSHAQAHLKS